MRRVLDLDLVRNNSPLFSLSWQVMHVIDESSPLYGRSMQELVDERTIFIVTLTGIDNTFSEAVHARRVYRDLDVVLGARFVDVIDFSNDQLVIDLRAFHDTNPDPMWPHGLQDQTSFSPEPAKPLPDPAGSKPGSAAGS